MTGGIWVGIVATAIAALIAYAIVEWLRDRRAERREKRERAEHVGTWPEWTLEVLPISQWPWGQQPARYMFDPEGYVAGPLGDPEGWIAANRSNIEHGFRTTLRRVEPWER